MSECASCGVELVPGAGFCIQCGAGVASADPEPASAPASPATTDDPLGLTAKFDSTRALEVGLSVLPLALRVPTGRLDDLHIVVVSPAWSKPRKYDLPVLQPQSETVVQIPVEPERAGHTMFKLTLTFRDAEGVPHCLSGEGGPISVVPPGSDTASSSIEIDADGAVVGDLSALAGQQGRLNIKSKGMVVLNMDQYDQSQPERRARWSEVPLTYETRLVEDLRQTLLSARRCPYCLHQPERTGTECAVCGLATPSYTHKIRVGAEWTPGPPAGDLELQCHQTQRHHLVFTGNVVRLGRQRSDPRTGGRSNEVVLRLWPETSRNEERALMISRNHAILRVEHEELTLRFLKSAPKQVERADSWTIRDGSIVPFLEELSLEFRLCEKARRVTQDAEETTVTGTNRQHYLLSCAFKRGDSYGPLESYLVLRREAELVQNSAGRLRWGERGQTLLRLVRQDQAVWVEDSAGRGDIWVGNHRVAVDELVELKPGDLLRAGDYSFGVSRLE